MPPKLFRFNDAVQKLYERFFLILFFPMLLIGCEKRIDLSSKEPYSQAIGKSFVLQCDYYIFQFNDSKDLLIGKIDEMPGEVSQKNIGLKFRSGIIIGIVKKGTLFQIQKITEETTIEDSYYYYYISIFSQKNLINASFLATSEIFHNPPFTKTWSDPPIFDPQAALPLPSDGVWWK